MEYGLPHFKKFPINNQENIRLSLENFDKCPERFKEELATNIYIASLKEGVEIDDNDTIFRYVDFNNESINLLKAPPTEIKMNEIDELQGFLSKNESCVASLAVPDAKPFEDNKYIDRTEIDDEPNETFDFNNIFMENFKDEEERQVLTEAPANSKRKQIESMIYDFFSTIDITGANTKKYKEMFSKMSDEQFNKYMKKFLYDDSQNFYLEVLPNKNEPTLKLIKKCADKLGIPLDEYVYYRHDGDKDKPIRTSYKVPVGNLILKRMQQTLSKKNTYSLSISSRNMKTGTVTGHDKIA